MGTDAGNKFLGFRCLHFHGIYTIINVAARARRAISTMISAQIIQVVAKQI